MRPVDSAAQTTNGSPLPHQPPAWIFVSASMRSNAMSETLPPSFAKTQIARLDLSTLMSRTTALRTVESRWPKRIAAERDCIRQRSTTMSSQTPSGFVMHVAAKQSSPQRKVQSLTRILREALKWTPSQFGIWRWFSTVTRSRATSSQLENVKVQHGASRTVTSCTRTRRHESRKIGCVGRFLMAHTICSRTSGSTVAGSISRGQ